MLKDFLQDLSIQNQHLRSIYKLIYNNGPVTRADIIKKTEINRKKASLLIEELEKRDYIHTSGYAEPTGGRPPILYHVNSGCSYIIGVQINRIHTRIVLFDLLLNMCEQNVIPMTPNHTPEVVIGEIKNTINKFMAQFNFSFNQLLGIGIGTIGPLDKEQGIILKTEPPLAKGWDNVPIVNELKEAFPVEILLENGVNAVVIGESKNTEITYNNLLNVRVGWTLGCGIFTNGNLVHSKSKNLSDYGHMIVDMDGKKCACGKRGCLVSYVSLAGILEEIKERSPELYNANRKKIENKAVDQLMEFLLMKEPVIEETILNSARYLGIGVANMVNLLHSDLLILNGPLIDYYPNYYERVIEFILQYVISERNIKIKKEKYEGKSVVFGAATQVLEYFFESE